MNKSKIWFAAILAFVLLLSAVLAVGCKSKERDATVTVTNKISRIYLGEQYEFVAERKNTDRKIKWTTSDEGVLYIGLSSGKAEARGLGEVTVTAECGKVKDEFTLTVEEGERPVISVKDVAAYPANSEEILLDCTLTYKNAAITGVSFTYKSENEDIFTVSADGAIRGVKSGEGEVTVYAEYKRHKVTGTGKVTVYQNYGAYFVRRNGFTLDSTAAGNKAPTCVDEGAEIWMKNGEEPYTVTVDALGHDWAEKGEELECSRCSAVKTVVYAETDVKTGYNLSSLIGRNIRNYEFNGETISGGELSLKNENADDKEQIITVNFENAEGKIDRVVELHLKIWSLIVKTEQDLRSVNDYLVQKKLNSSGEETAETDEKKYDYAYFGFIKLAEDITLTAAWGENSSITPHLASFRPENTLFKNKAEATKGSQNKLKYFGFRGVFDGNGKTISNFLAEGNDCAMFGVVGDGAVIKNFTISDAELYKDSVYRRSVLVNMTSGGLFEDITVNLNKVAAARYFNLSPASVLLGNIADGGSTNEEEKGAYLGDLTVKNITVNVAKGVYSDKENTDFIAILGGLRLKIATAAINTENLTVNYADNDDLIPLIYLSEKGTAYAEKTQEFAGVKVNLPVLKEFDADLSDSIDLADFVDGKTIVTVDGEAIDTQINYGLSDCGKVFVYFVTTSDGTVYQLRITLYYIIDGDAKFATYNDYMNERAEKITVSADVAKGLDLTAMEALSGKTILRVNGEENPVTTINFDKTEAFVKYGENGEIIGNRTIIVETADIKAYSVSVVVWSLIINNEDDLLTMQKYLTYPGTHFVSGYFKLNADLDMNKTDADGKTYKSVYAENPKNYMIISQSGNGNYGGFTGVFDGFNHTINNFGDGGVDYGSMLINNLGASGEFKNVTFKNYSSSRHNGGLINCVLGGTIENITVEYSALGYNGSRAAFIGYLVNCEGNGNNPVVIRGVTLVNRTTETANSVIAICYGGDLNATASKITITGVKVVGGFTFMSSQKPGTAGFDYESDNLDLSGVTYLTLEEYDG